MSESYRYTIEGEKLTMVEIISRVPEIQADTIRARVNRGVRTWDGLRQSSKAAIQAERDRQRRLISPYFNKKKRR